MQLAPEGQLAAGPDRIMAGEDLLDERRARTRETEDEDRLRDIGPTCRARQGGDGLRVEDACQLLRLPLDLRGRIMAVRALGEDCLPARPVGPGGVGGGGVEEGAAGLTDASL